MINEAEGSLTLHPALAKLAFDARAGDRCRELGIQPEEICAPTPN